MMSPGLAIMDDGKDPASARSSAPGDDGGVEGRFQRLCKTELALDDETFKQGLRLVQQSKSLLLAHMSSIGGGSMEETERFWFACVLFSVKRLSVTTAANQERKIVDGGAFSLCNILKATKLTVVEFCREMPQFFLRSGLVLSNMYGSDWEKRLQVKVLQEDFVQLSLLSNFYNEAYRKYFQQKDTNNDKLSDPNDSAKCLCDFHRFGWLLFLLLRIRVFSRFKDLVTCTTGLVSVLAILILHVPHRFRKFSFGDTTTFVKKSEKGVDIISSLCEIYQTSEDEIRKMMRNMNNLIVDILKKVPGSASKCKSENLDNVNTDGLVYFEDLMKGESMTLSLQVLEKQYCDAIDSKGDIDERMFIEEDETLLGTASVPGSSINLSGIKRKFETLYSPIKNATCNVTSLHSPTASLSNSKLDGVDVRMTSTPVSTAMTTVKWLRTVISPLPSKPSPELEAYFLSCDRDISYEILYRAHVILAAIFPGSHERVASSFLHSSNLMDTIWADERKMEALKLYYRVLEAICRAESNLLKGNNLTSLLSNERFHRCMLACSSELILATYKTTAILFPAVLEKTGITAFDLSKVIETFVRHEDSLPRELKRHLNSLEERLLESATWEKGSSLYNSLIIARPNLASEVNRQALLAEPMPSLDAIAAQHNISTETLSIPVPRDQNGGRPSPKKFCGELKNVVTERNSLTATVRDGLLTHSQKDKVLPPLQSVFASPTRPSPAGGGETCAETGIQIFFTKILKLAAIRVKNLCERLHLSQEVMEDVYNFIKKILNQQTAIFFNRHIDQLILCSIYGVAKISEVKLSFKDIICNYKKQSYCKTQVFRSVYVNSSSMNRNGRTGGRDHVDVITFYNDVFIPTVKQQLMEMGPHVSAVRMNGAAENETMNDGAGRHGEGPRSSPFPSIPDISPKKVSAAHNVYVSPLRSSKMDTWISPSSRSYYACVGQSTHAYQSPSKDLSAINDRLKSCRKMKLNFDELISDSAVASSLYPQNGKSTHSSCIIAPRKSGQSEQ